MGHLIAQVQRVPNCLSAYAMLLRCGATVPGQQRPTWLGFVDSLHSTIDTTRPSWEAQRCGQDIGSIVDFVRAKKPLRLPVVVTRDEVSLVLSNLRGLPVLMASLLQLAHD